MDHNMFCFQCEQTAGCTGCTSRGVCGKDAQTAQVQDRLTGALIGLADPVYRNSYITYLCMFVFVLAYLVLTLQEKYYKNFKHRELILVIFLTYMALIVKTNIPVINSILIMLIALVSVTAGFVKKDKPVRIYGLVLSLCTCGKIALYDYWGAPILQKTILFFVVGVIALVIAGIYIILEKKCNE